VKEFVTIGRVKDAHGLKGELFITLKAGEAPWLKRLKELRLIPPSGGDARNFAIKSARVHKNGMIVLSPDINGRNEAEALKGWSLEIPSEFLVSKRGEQIYLIEIQDFKLHVSGRGEVGTITKFSSNGAQDLLVVETPSGEFDIPFVDAFVKGIDYEAQVVEMDLPEGLLGEPVDETPEPDAGARDDE
jgi:16S rRNA processing protein RimM